MSLMDAIIRAWPTAQCVTSGDSIVRWDGPMPQPSEADVLAAVGRHLQQEPFTRLRKARNVKLAESDWTQLLDSQLDQPIRTAWATYRQALRDLPQTNTNAAAIVWPVAPA